MKLQVALDTLSLKKALEMLEQLRGIADIAEVGTPMLLRYGRKAVRQFKKACPEMIVLADGKIMDGGEFEADLLFEAGAEIVTVLGAASDSTVRGVIKSAGRHNGKVMADLIEVKDFEKRAKELVSLGVDFVCVHNGYDIKNNEGMDYLGQLRLVNRAVGADKTVMAGGVNPGNIDDILREGAAIVVCGEYIVTNPEPSGAAKALKYRFFNSQ